MCMRWGDGMEGGCEDRTLGEAGVPNGLKTRLGLRLLFASLTGDAGLCLAHLGSRTSTKLSASPC